MKRDIIRYYLWPNSTTLKQYLYEIIKLYQKTDFGNKSPPLLTYRKNQPTNQSTNFMATRINYQCIFVSSLLYYNKNIQKYLLAEKHKMPEKNKGILSLIYNFISSLNSSSGRIIQVPKGNNINHYHTL